MKINIGIMGAALAAAGTLLSSFALADDHSATQKMDPQMEEMMKKAEAAGKPGAAHQALEPLVGNWQAAIKCWMAPDSPATESKGTAKTSWILNGRFVQEEFTGEFTGKPFHGMGLTGYDNMKQKYTSVWIDDMSTGIFTSQGEAEKDGKVITLEGKMDCPATGQKDMAMKQIVRVISPDKHILEMYDQSKGDPFKTMEITYSRIAGFASK